MQQDVKRNNSLVKDNTYNLKQLQEKVAEMDAKQQSIDAFTRNEIGKIHDRLDKLEAGLEATRKLVKKISESLAGRNANNTGSNSNVVISGSDISREEFDKLK